MANTYTYSRREEVANAVTHGIGAALSVAALVLLIVFSSMKGTVWHVVSFTIYGITMLLLYTNSTMVHALKEGKAKDLFEFLTIHPSTFSLQVPIRRFCSWQCAERLDGPCSALFGASPWRASFSRRFSRNGFCSCPRCFTSQWAG